MDYSLVVAVLFSFAGGGLVFKMYSEWVDFKKSINSVIGVSSEGFRKASDVDEKVSKLTDSVDEIGKNQTEFMNLVGLRVSELKNEVAGLKDQIFMPAETQNAPIGDIRVFEESYVDTYNDLIMQGLDPETAKYKAAEQEMARIAEFGSVEALGFGE